VLIDFNGLTPAMKPAVVYSMVSHTNWMITMRTSICAKITIAPAISPSALIPTKMKKMKIGMTGMMNLLMTASTIFLSSNTTLPMTLALPQLAASPMTIANTNADMISMNGGNSISTSGSGSAVPEGLAKVRPETMPGMIRYVVIAAIVHAMIVSTYDSMTVKDNNLPALLLKSAILAAMKLKMINGIKNWMMLPNSDLPASVTLSSQFGATSPTKIPIIKATINLGMSPNFILNPPMFYLPYL